MKLSEIKARCEDFRRDGEHTIGVNLTAAEALVSWCERVKPWLHIYCAGSHCEEERRTLKALLKELE